MGRSGARGRPPAASPAAARRRPVGGAPGGWSGAGDVSRPAQYRAGSSDLLGCRPHASCAGRAGRPVPARLRGVRHPAPTEAGRFRAGFIGRPALGGFGAGPAVRCRRFRAGSRCWPAPGRAVPRRVRRPVPGLFGAGPGVRQPACIRHPAYHRGRAVPRGLPARANVPGRAARAGFIGRPAPGGVGAGPGVRCRCASGAHRSRAVPCRLQAQARTGPAVPRRVRRPVPGQDRAVSRRVHPQARAGPVRGRAGRPTPVRLRGVRCADTCLVMRVVRTG